MLGPADGMIMLFGATRLHSLLRDDSQLAGLAPEQCAQLLFLVRLLVFMSSFNGLACLVLARLARSGPRVPVGTQQRTAARNVIHHTVYRCSPRHPPHTG